LSARARPPKLNEDTFRGDWFILILNRHLERCTRQVTRNWRWNLDLGYGIRRELIPRQIADLFADCLCGLYREDAPLGGALLTGYGTDHLNRRRQENGHDRRGDRDFEQRHAAARDASITGMRIAERLSHHDRPTQGF
jgi:hypothetical protein